MSLRPSNVRIPTYLLVIRTAAVRYLSRRWHKTVHSSSLSYRFHMRSLLKVHRGSVCSPLVGLSTGLQSPIRRERPHYSWLPLDQSNIPDTFLIRNCLGYLHSVCAQAFLVQIKDCSCSGHKLLDIQGRKYRLWGSSSLYRWTKHHGLHCRCSHHLKWIQPVDPPQIWWKS